MITIDRRKSRGFTLIEIAIVVVIIGLLIGGILKGQEMIRNARAHNVADQGTAVKAAVLAFQDRFRALPGDYAKANDNIVGLNATQMGDGNSRVGGDPDAANGTDEATNRTKEIALVWKHLSAAGFLSGTFDGNAAAVDSENWTCDSETCMTNAYNGFLMFLYDRAQYHYVDATNTTAYKEGPKSNQLLTGGLIPIEIISELDRKVDDGDPGKGSFRIGHKFLDGSAGNTTSCANGTGVISRWNIASQNTNCGGVYLF